MTIRARLLASSVISIACLVGSGAAHAQSGGAASGTTLNPPTAVSTSGTSRDAASAARTPHTGSQLQDIIVTARRSNEKLQTTPVAVTALNNQMLLQRQITEVYDLARATPSLSIGTGGTGPATIVYLAIRGQAQNSPNSFSDPAVGIYIDGVYVARPIVGNLGFLDAGSAEVLRGPQGTLFGRNTTGGALNLTSASPTDKFEGYIKAGGGNYAQRSVEGVVNIPVTDDVATRIAARYDGRSGYFDNPEQHDQSGINGEYYVRGSVKWQPKSLPIVLDVIGDYTHYKDTGNAVAVAAINPTGPLATFYALAQAGTPGFQNFIHGPAGPIDQYINAAFATDAQKPILLSKSWKTTFENPETGDHRIDELYGANEAGSVTANLTVNLDTITFKSITGYRKSSSASNLDLTGTLTGGGAFVSHYHQHQFSEEVQASGKIGKLDYIFGAIYFREAGFEFSDSAIFYDTPFAAYADSLGAFVSTSKGAFAQVNYHLNDRLRLTGGIRYTWDTREINRHGTNDWETPDPTCAVGVNTGVPLSQGDCSDKHTANFHYPAWTAGIDYKLDDGVFVYIKTSGASNSGGFNNRLVPPPYSSAFRPENVRDIEGGFKGEFLNRHVRTNIAAFTAWQSDVQRIVDTTFLDATGATRLTQFVSNAGKVRTYGLEFEGTVIPWRGMDISGSFAYLHAAYVKGSRTETQLVGNEQVSVDRSGEPITQAPKWTGNISATQTFDLSTGKLTVHGDWSYISDRYFDYFTTGDPAQAAAVAIANRASDIKGYGLFSAQISFALRHPALEFTLWGKNLADKANFVNVFNSYTGLGATIQNQGAPRTYGGTVAYRF